MSLNFQKFHGLFWIHGFYSWIVVVAAGCNKSNSLNKRHMNSWIFKHEHSVLNNLLKSSWAKITHTVQGKYMIFILMGSYNVRCKDVTYILEIWHMGMYIEIYFNDKSFEGENIIYNLMNFNKLKKPSLHYE